MFKNVYNELGLFNAHVLVMLVQFYRNVNKLCLKQANNNNKKKEKKKRKENEHKQSRRHYFKPMVTAK